MSTESKIYYALVGDIDVPDPASLTSYKTDATHVLPTSKLLQRGDIIEVTEEFIDATRDRNGISWASDLTPDAQVRRWGEQRFASGSTPADVTAELDAAAEAEAAAQVFERRRAAHVAGTYQATR